LAPRLAVVDTAVEAVVMVEEEVDTEEVVTVVDVTVATVVVVVMVDLVTPGVAAVDLKEDGEIRPAFMSF
uniref:hypothetical protein n=1 Tax=Escherichia coli TaxID=562 RepID=UPI0020019DA7